MSRFILRLFLALLLTSMALGWPATPKSVPSEHEDDLSFGIISISTTTGNPPLAVRVHGWANEGYPFVAAFHILVDFAGTTYTELSGTYAGYLEFDFSHMFPCPGTYEVRAWIDTGSFNDMIDLRTWTVEVTGDPVPYTIAIQYGSPTPRIRLEYIGLTSPDLITSATIDWGDGSELMDVIFTLFSNGTVYSQFYYPSSTGEFTATAKTYATFPCFDASSRTETWSWPLVPVEPTTWGRVKALYK